MGVRVAVLVLPADLRIFADDAVVPPGEQPQRQRHPDAVLAGRAEDALETPVPLAIVEGADDVRGIIAGRIQAEGIQVLIPGLAGHLQRAEGAVDRLVVKLRRGPLLQGQGTVAEVIDPCPEGDAVLVRGRLRVALCCLSHGPTPFRSGDRAGGKIRGTDRGRLQQITSVHQHVAPYGGRITHAKFCGPGVNPSSLECS